MSCSTPGGCGGVSPSGGFRAAEPAASPPHLRRGRIKEGRMPSANQPPLRLILGAVVGTAVYLGLAILGSGGFTAFFSHPARTSLVVIFVALTVASLFTSGNLSAGEREDRSNRWVLVAFSVLGLASAFLPAWTERREIWTIDGDTLRWTGVALCAVGGAL